MPLPNLNSDNYYEILGCSKGADEAALKKAYKKLAVKWHPDKNPGNDQATKNFQKVSEAYATLSDPKKRKLYDQYGVDGVNAADQMGEDNMPPGGGFGFRPGPGGGGGAHHMSPEEAQAFFGSFFGGADPFGGPFGGMGGSGMGGGPNIRFQTQSMGGGGMGGAPDISMLFGGGGPGMGGSFGGGGGGLPPGFGGMGGSFGGGGGMPAGFGGSSSSRRQAPKRYDVIPSGTVVSLKELIAAPERNGDTGVVKQYIPEKDRYVVVFEESDETMSVKSYNLLQHVKVRLHDIVSQPLLNGKTGSVMAWNPSKERYNIYVTANQKVVSLKPGNVVLDNGTVGKITGLNSKPELNGKWGTVKQWIRETNKYDIQLSQDKIIRIKVENLRV